MEHTHTQKHPKHTHTPVCGKWLMVCTATYTDMHTHVHECGASQVALVVKNPPAKAGDARDAGSIPVWGRSPGGAHGSPLQSSSLESPSDRGAWWATVHSTAENRTRLKRPSLHSHTRMLEHTLITTHVGHCEGCLAGSRHVDMSAGQTDTRTP